MKDSLHHSETTEKDDPKQPANDGEISDDQSCHRQTVTLQLRSLFYFGKRKVSANHPGSRSQARNRKARANSEQATRWQAAPSDRVCPGANLPPWAP